MDGVLDRGRARAVLAPPDASAQLETARPHEGAEPGRALVSVARISGGVSYGRGGDAEGWRPASVGLPVATGDRLYAARGACSELRAADLEIHLASGTGLEAIEVSADVRRFYVWGGSASFLVRRLPQGESFGVDTPNAAVTFERAGEYRIDVGREGDTGVFVERGSAWAAAAGVSVPLGPGDLARIEGIQVPVCATPRAPARLPGPCRGATSPVRSRDQVLAFRSRASR